MEIIMAISEKQKELRRNALLGRKKARSRRETRAHKPTRRNSVLKTETQYRYSDHKDGTYSVIE
jgi:hypothetical protein